MNKIILGLLLALCAPSYAGIDPGPITLPLAISSGGTGTTTQQLALDAIAGAVTSGRFLRGDGTHVTLSAIVTGDLPSSAVTPGSYTSANITVDSHGLVTAAANGSGGGGSPGGSDTQIQYNSSGSFAGSANLTYDASNSSIRVNTPTTVGRFSIGNPTANPTTPLISMRITDAPTFGFDIFQDSQVTGDLTIGRYSLGVSHEAMRIKRDSDGVIIPGYLRFSGSSSGYVGLIGPASGPSLTFTLPSADGTNGQFIKTNGSGVLSFASAAVTAGSTSQIQYNTSGALDATSNFTWDNSSKALNMTAGTGKSLSMTSSTNATYMEADSTNGVQFVMGADGPNSQNFFGSQSNHPIKFRTNNVNRAQLGASGGFELLTGNNLIFDGSSSGTLTIGVPAGVTSYAVTMPSAQATLAGQCLSNDASGALTWSNGYTKVTKTFTNFSTAASTNSITLFSLPAATMIKDIIIRPTTAFTGGSISAYTISVGISGNNAKYASAFDVLSAITGTRFQVSNSTDMENFGSSTTITATATSTGDTLNNAGAGSVDIYYSLKGLP